MSIQSYISKVKNAIKELEDFALSGNFEEHLVYAEIKAAELDEYLSDSIKTVESNAIDVVLNNYLEYGKKTFESNGLKYSVKNGRTMYYFNEIEEVQQAKELLKKSRLHTKLKRIENKYKAAFIQKQKGLAMFDEETGEEIDVSKVKIVHSKSSLIVKPI